MIKTALFSITFFCIQMVFAQTNDVWIRFYDTAAHKSGFKDLNGNIKIPALFEGYTRADSFYNIAAVTEVAGDKYRMYYLLKDGRKVGYDSVYMFDTMEDCESEGKIIFYDRKKDRVGFLDKSGKAAIPAMYNYVTPFKNGLSIAVKNAVRHCADGGDIKNCEHLGWKGGEAVLINEQNEILVDSLQAELHYINWYSKRINDVSVDTNLYVSVKGRNNITYSFLDYKKEFTQWFYKTFIPSLSNQTDFDHHLFKQITYWKKDEGWVDIDKETFLKQFATVLTPEKFDTNTLKHLSIDDEIFPFMSDSPVYRQYYDACGEHNRYRYPAFNAMIIYYKKREKPLDVPEPNFYTEHDIDHQEHFVFLRTSEGYQLIRATVPDKILP